MGSGTLFAQDFLLTGIRDTDDWRGLDDREVDATAAALRACLADAGPGLREANTETLVIYPILDALGWGERRLVQGQLDKIRRLHVPDAVYFASPEARRAAQARPPAEHYAEAAFILENKAWEVPLDRAQGRAVTPSAQLQTYLNRAYFGSDRRVRFGVLTNGRLWRLYDYEAKSLATDFFEVDLAALVGLKPAALPLFAPRDEDRAHWLKVFVLLFRREAFETGARGRTFHAEARERGKDWEESVRTGIADVVFGTVFPRLLRGLKAADRKAPDPPTPAYLAELREAVFTLLYRLLFTFYAEDRGLIPTTDRRADDYSFRRGVRDTVERRLSDDDTFSRKRTDLYDFALRVFETVDEGDPSVGVPPFNGGLFARARAPLLARARLPDAEFAPLVDALSRRNGKRINYRDLSVRELGSIYERLLEYEPVASPAAPAGIDIRLSAFARKGSGSYYTPDELVRLIIERTVGPLVDEKVEAFRAHAQRIGEAGGADEVMRAELAGKDAGAAILTLKICDPAMGSGHFLVSLIDFLAARVFRATVEAVAVAEELGIADYRSPVLAQAEETRRRIEALGREQGWSLHDEHLTDEAIVRRMVLKRCVYGVDKNPMAVELAKVALWLHTLTAGAPLSFLDHHLRCGDSLFGEWVRPAMDALSVRAGLFINRTVRDAMAGAAEMAKVEASTDADLAEAEASRHSFEEVEARTAVLRGLLDTWQALKWIELDPGAGRKDERPERSALDAALDGAFGDPVRVLGGALPPQRPAGVTEEALSLFEAEGGEQLALKVERAGTARDFALFERLLARARALAREERFLHWEVAFPGVWEDWTGAGREGGFDAVIGNPPWDRMKMQEVEWFAARAPQIARQPRAADRKRLVAELEKAGDPLFRDYERAAARAETAMERARRSGDYPLLSRGDINLYSLFVERAQGLLAPHGIAGLLVPSGIASDLTASAFFRSVATAGRVLCLFDFENRGIFFPDVHNSFKFAAFVVGGATRSVEATECAFFLHDVPENVEEARRFHLTAADFALVNPNTGTAPIFRSRRDAEITTAIYQRLPVLVDRSTGEQIRAWPVRYSTMFHMTNDSHSFWRRERLEKEGAYEAPLGRWAKGKRMWVPLYEGKMTHAFDHRAADVVVNSANVHRPAQPEPIEARHKADPHRLSTPQYWVEETHTADYALPVQILGFKEVTAPTNERGMIAALLPPAGFGNTIPVVYSSSDDSRQHAVFWAGCWNSFVFDYVARSKIQGQHLNWFILEQLPVVPHAMYECGFGPTSAADLVKDHVLRLTYTAWDMEPFARDMGYDGPPFIWNETERRHLRARLDALYFILYGITAEDDVRYILSTFPIVERKDRAAYEGVYLTAELIVHYKRMLEAGDLAAPYWGVTEPAARSPARLDLERQRAERLEAALIRAASARPGARRDVA